MPREASFIIPTLISLIVHETIPATVGVHHVGTVSSASGEELSAPQIVKELNYSRNLFIMRVVLFNAINAMKRGMACVKRNSHDLIILETKCDAMNQTFS